MSNGKGPVKAVTEDKKVQRDLRSAAESLREASDRLRGKRKKRRWGRLLVIALLGAALAIALSEDLRKAVLDRLFGAEEEFEYSSHDRRRPAEHRADAARLPAVHILRPAQRHVFAARRARRGVR